MYFHFYCKSRCFWRNLHRWQKYCWLCHFASLFHQQISISTILVQSRLIHMRLLLIRNGVKVNCIFMMRARLALILALKWNPNYVHGLDYVSPWWIIHVIQLKILAQSFGKHNTKVMLTLMEQDNGHLEKKGKKNVFQVKACLDKRCVCMKMKVAMWQPWF